MLTEDERARIRVEEVFRLEVRRELEASKPPASRRERLGQWLNSSFGLWLLSSVVLTGLTTAYTYYQNRRGEEVKKAETERRLDTEISNRMSSALARLRVDQNDIGQGRLYDPAAVYGQVASYLDNSFIDEPKDPQDFSIYPEYRKRSFRSLLVELSTIVDPSSLPELREAAQGYIRCKDLASVQNAMPPEAAEAKRESTEAVVDSMQRLKSLMRDRWRSRM